MALEQLGVHAPEIKDAAEPFRAVGLKPIASP